MTATKSEPISHTIASEGEFSGLNLTGRAILPAEHPADVPLIIALHGGTYTSEYFDIPGHSLLTLAGDAGIPIIALDRPGYAGSTALAPEDSTILKNAEVLDGAIGELWQKYGAGTTGIVLIGHSIGGAIATAIAARQPSWPLLGLAVSGCLLDVPKESAAAWEALPDIPFIDLPTPMKDQVMFGPADSVDDAMPAASYPSNAPVPRAELIDITTTWIAGLRELAAKITVPVMSRQAEFDALWITDEDQVKQFGEIFTSSPVVDAKLFKQTGHCIDFHRLGTAFQLEELAFALRCSVLVSA
ncbi:alpha/beta fold hydrolase [Subtercola lobariae]|uniref:Thioesterase n=1 Tax=Subtercola lobariae TaxID=1588641 RepID=A0A917B3R5_9MICO|nr:alpha/beta hydrolase [Subtercola lobariae]GGF21406.1 thioesterase [Subtercola lobariae]